MTFKRLGSTDLRVSELGFGCAPLGNEYGVTDPGEAARAVRRAIDLGINFFDTAPYYGRTLSETRLGEALEGRRQEVVLATKCGRYDVAGFDFSAKRVRESIDESLRRLRTDYLDLFQAHDIEFGDERQIIEETIPAMREAQRQGKARYIGITGLQLGILRRVAEAQPVDTILSYCRYNLLNTRLDEVLTPFAQERGIGLINASPLHMGILTEQGPPPWHPAPAEVKEAGARIVAACAARGVKASDVGLRFALDHPVVASTFVGMQTVEQVEQNVRSMEARVDAGVWEEIERIVAPVKNRGWGSGRPENQD